MTRFIALLLLVAGAAAAQEPASGVPASEFAQRRARLMAAYPQGIVILYARDSAALFAEPGFRQDKNFYYFTGLDTPGAVLAVDGPRKEARLFVRGTPPAGPLAAAPRAELGRYMDERVKQGVTSLYDTYLGPDVARQLPPDESGSAQGDDLRKQFSQAKWENIRPALLQMRWTKSAAELQSLRRAGWASAAALRAAIRGIRPGRPQREVEAEVVASCIRNGAEGHSFWPWISSGPNSVYPRQAALWQDYQALNRQMLKDEVVWLDLGCTREHYEGDVGRTVPVSGKFTAEQREAWDLLVRGYRAARSAVRPGSTIAGAQKAFAAAMQAAQPKSDYARAFVAEALRDKPAQTESLHIHAVGLSPVERPQPEFVAGATIAIEARVSLEAQNAGFIIEDMFELTPRGAETISGGVPETAEEIEAFMATPARASYTVVDSHNHMDPPQHTAEQLIREMNVLGMSKSIVFGGPRADHEYILKAATQYPDRLVPFYRASVREEQDAWLRNDPKILAELQKQISSGRWRGIGEFSNVHYPPGRQARMGEALLDTEVSPLAPMVISMFKLADQYHLPVLVHNEVYYYKEFDELLSRFPNVTVIWAHGGYVNYYGIDMALKKHKNLYIDLSIRALYRPSDLREASIFHSAEMLKPMWTELIERYPDRFVSGMDDSSGGYKSHAQYFEWLGKLLDQLTPATARKVAVENIERLLAGSR